MNKKLIFTFFTLAGSLIATAQDTTLKIPKLTVTSEYQPKLTDAVKVEVSISPETPQAQLPVLTYRVDPFDYKIKPQFTLPKAEKLGDSEQRKIKNNYLKLGFGNPNMPFAQLFLQSLPSNKGNYGINIHHLSANGDLNKKFADNQASVFGEKYFKSGTLWGSIDYQRTGVHYYGFDTAKIKELSNEDSLKQVFNYYGANIGFGRPYAAKNKPGYYGHFNFYHLNGLNNTKEFDYNLKGNYQMNVEGNPLLIFASFDYSQYTDSLVENNRIFFDLKPRFTYKKENWQAVLGFNFNIFYSDFNNSRKAILAYSDSINAARFFPHIEFDYFINPKKLNFYAGITGDVQKNSMLSISRNNPFINSSNNLNSTINRFEIKAGLKGNLGSKFGYLIGIQHNTFNNFILFKSDTTDLRRFVIDHEDLRRLTFKISMMYHYSEKIRTGVDFNYYRYDLENQKRPWQLPDFDLKLYANYNIGNKIIAKANFFVIGPRYSTEIFKNTENQLKTILDFNLGFEYRYSKSFGLFLDFNNLSAQRYQYWYNYPSFGFNVMGGLIFNL